MELEKTKQRFEFYESIILSIAILGTAWSAYQAALWNGIQTFRLAEVAASSRAAMEKHLFTEQQFTLDGIQVLHIVDHLVEGRTKIVEFYVSRIRPELRTELQESSIPGRRGPRCWCLLRSCWPQWLSCCWRPRWRGLEGSCESCMRSANSIGALSRCRAARVLTSRR